MVAAVTLSAILQQRWEQTWLVGIGAERFWPQLRQFQAQLQTQQPQSVVLAEPDPVRFLAAFLAACQQPCQVWLANPHWGLEEWQQVVTQCHPDWVIGRVPPTVAARWRNRPVETPARAGYVGSLPSPPTGNSRSSAPPSEPSILIPTGGSSGALRFAAHTWTTLTASVQGFQQHFHCPTVNAYCVLPLFHVSGLMQALRCLLSGGVLICQPFQALLQEGMIAPVPDPAFLSLVPTQLQRLLKCDRDFTPWLQSFTAILLGGAPPWPSLLHTARQLLLPLAPTYGMTETASQVATLHPHEFLVGNRSSGRTLPHASITIRDTAGQPLPPGQTGLIAIEAASLAQAYSQTPVSVPLQTGDLGYLDAAGYLYVLGRQTTLILTGGEKVLPEEVEAAILATGMVQDAAVVGIPDDDWGETVVAVVVSEAPVEGGDRLRQTLKPRLSPYKIPKRWLQRPSLPRNAQGKLNRADLRQWVIQQLQCPPVTTGSALTSGDSAAE
ncbi:MAG: AMP-binding protein [Leptolyngbya sp. SIO1E4]|nr:AMP-binding protein [Leptolyngbya sp. SIO1E4]